MVRLTSFSTNKLAGGTDFPLLRNNTIESCSISFHAFHLPAVHRKTISSLFIAKSPLWEYDHPTFTRTGLPLTVEAEGFSLLNPLGYAVSQYWKLSLVVRYQFPFRTKRGFLGMVRYASMGMSMHLEIVSHW
jgi:hypothetical protein